MGLLFRRVADNRDRESLATRMRRRRFALFIELMASVPRPVRILDVGGTPSFWGNMGMQPSEDLSITVLNKEPAGAGASDYNIVEGDARDMRFKDREFDVVFSNSVIEHVGDFADQQSMAREVDRVGQRYFVHTPNKRFPIEPHFCFPLFQYLPVSARTALLRRFNLGWRKKCPDPTLARQQVESIRLLTKGQLRTLFPEATIWEERLFLLTKSFVAYARW